MIGDGKSTRYFRIDEASGRITIQTSLGEDTDLEYVVSIVVMK